jgi:hypothetical protein
MALTRLQQQHPPPLEGKPKSSPRKMWQLRIESDDSDDDATDDGG